MAMLVLICALTGGAIAQTLATVGGAEITVDEFKKRLTEIKAKDIVPPSTEEFLEDLVRYKIGLQEAERQKLDRDPVVRERFAQVLYNSLLEKELGPKLEKVRVTESQMKTFYETNPELHLAHVLVDVKEEASPEDREVARQRAEANLEDIKKSKRPFEELVRLYSDDQSTKESGGDLGFQTRTTLLPDIYDIAVRMKVGEVKGLIASRDGYHILKLIGRRPYDLADKRQIRSALVDKTREDLFNEYFGRLKKQKTYRVQVNKEALRSLQ